MKKINSFPPLCDANARVLILGSMPGNASLTADEYYAHPRNAFWPIMSQLFAIPRELDYKQRCEQLIDYNIALWDVMASCQRTGSLDTNIKSNSIIAHDFNNFFNHHNKINAVFFNGTKAEKEYYKRVTPYLSVQYQQLQYQRLPSTSPAMASLSQAQKATQWSVIQQVLYAN